MKKEELLYVLSKIEPRNELKEQTKLKMMNIVMTRDTVKNSPNFFRKTATAVCAAAFAFVCITTVGMQKFMPRSYVAVMDENDAVSMVCEENIPSRMAEEPIAFIADTREESFREFLATLEKDYRALGIAGEIVSKETFVLNDASEVLNDASEYGIYGFAILNVKISDVFFSENEPFFGIKKGDTVSFVQYVSSDSEMNAVANEGECVDLFAYSGKNLSPIDKASETLGIDNAFVIFK